MKLEDAREFTKIIRKEKYRPNPIQEQFIKSIETGKGHFVAGMLSSKQSDWLRSIYQKATQNSLRHL